MLRNQLPRRAVLISQQRGFHTIGPLYHERVREARRTFATQSPLTKKIDKFLDDTDRHLPKDGAGVCFATAWLVTDNVFVALMRAHFPKVLDGMTLLAVDTMHLFPTTHVVADEVQKKYAKQASLFYPEGCRTVEQFLEVYGDCEKMDVAEFEYASKVEPFTRGLNESGKQILITGRRMDQGAARDTPSQRTNIDIWEADRKVLNPLADWSWSDITEYVDTNRVPYNKLHNYAFRCKEPIVATERHLPDLPWEKVDLGKPCWQVSDEELRGGSPIAYCFKSFGDTHTTVPVEPHESERAGRFVRQHKSECGIHTRSTFAGQPHGGELVDLSVHGSDVVELIASCARTIDLTERQACDVFCLVNGAFSPLRGFMTDETYNSVIKSMRLPEKQLFGLPVTFDVSDVKGLSAGDRLLLRWGGVDVAVLMVESIYKPDKAAEASAIFGTDSKDHPSVKALHQHIGEYYIGGQVVGLERVQFDYHTLTPREVREQIKDAKNVVSFQPSGPVSDEQSAAVQKAHKEVPDSTVLIHPACGPVLCTVSNGAGRMFDPKSAVAVEKGAATLSACMPYSPKMAGPREVIQSMIVRKNYGATHHIVGRGLIELAAFSDNYAPDAAQKMAEQHSSELGITVLKSDVHYQYMSNALEK